MRALHTRMGFTTLQHFQQVVLVVDQDYDGCTMVLPPAEHVRFRETTRLDRKRLQSFFRLRHLIGISHNTADRMTSDGSPQRGRAILLLFIIIIIAVLIGTVISVAATC